MTRAAASSRASGRPSSRLQISAMARAFSLVKAKSGLDAIARSTNNITAGLRASVSSEVVRRGSGRGSGGTGTDEKYVASICKAGAEFATAMEKLSKDLASEKDLEKAAEKAAEPFEDFAKAFAKANPPKDLKEWHDDASDALDKAVKGLKDGNFDALGDELMPDPPKDISDRLTKVADKNKDCQDADFSFGG